MRTHALFIHAHPFFMLMHPLFMHTRLCSTVHTNACPSMRMHIQVLRTYVGTQKLHFSSNLVFFFFFSLIFLIQHDSHATVPVFYRLYLLSFTSRGSAGHLFAWYRALTKDTKALVSMAVFKPVMCLLSESSASGILVQALAKRWWDTTHTFHITRTAMTVTPHDFHQKTSLRSNRAIINLKSESRI